MDAQTRHGVCRPCMPSPLVSPPLANHRTSKVERSSALESTCGHRPAKHARVYACPPVSSPRVPRASTARALGERVGIAQAWRRYCVPPSRAVTAPLRRRATSGRTCRRSASPSGRGPPASSSSLRGRPRAAPPSRAPRATRTRRACASCGGWWRAGDEWRVYVQRAERALVSRARVSARRPLLRELVDHAAQVDVGQQRLRAEHLWGARGSK